MTARAETARAVRAEAWFDVPMLRDLDPASRDAIAAASRRREVAAGELVYREGDESESFFFVVAGSVALRTLRRGDRDSNTIRTAQRGDTFGEEATLPGLGRRASASAEVASSLLEVPVAVFRRAVGRGAGDAADRERRYLRRAALRDLFAASALARKLPEPELETLLDGAALERIGRGQAIYAEGERAGDVFVLFDGLVQIQITDPSHPGRATVRAYLSRGDLFGDDDALAGAPRSAAAVSLGDGWCARLPAALIRQLSDRHPGLLAGLRRVAEDRQGAQAAIVARASERSTQHVFRDLYRMQMARSLLVIDQDSCVRCGHCAWSCADVHGVTRLIRRGDKVVARLVGTAADGAPSSLLLPNSCQQCRNAACMIDCPTGAIGRDLRGEVFIREELCTGCGNCAKACPWQNIQMAPRPAGARDAQVAVKCDLCRGYEAPACVEACPTGSLLRLDPSRDIEEVKHLLGQPAVSGTAGAPATGAGWIAGAVSLAIAVGSIGAAAHASGAWSPGRGLGLILGVASALLLVALAAYSVPKRLAARWRRRRVGKGMREADAPSPRSRTRPHFIAHLALGVIAAGCALGHAGASSAASSPAGLLYAAFWITAALGAAGALAYRWIPPRLTRLERRGLLPEDLAAERRALEDRLYRQTSGRSDLIKAIVERVLVPYARAPLGSVALALSARGLGGEEQRLRQRIDRALEGRGGDRLAGLDDLVRTVVELRAMSARRGMQAALRAWLPLHIVASSITLALLAVHVAVEVLW